MEGYHSSNIERHDPIIPVLLEGRRKNLKLSRKCEGGILKQVHRESLDALIHSWAIKRAFLLANILYMELVKLVKPKFKPNAVVLKKS